MSPLFLLATLAFAHADEESVHTHDARPVRAIGDLAVEGALKRLGVGAEAAVQVSASWMRAIAAPERSRREGRSDGWDYDVDRVWISERQVHDGQTVATREATSTWRTPVACATLSPQDASPLTLRPLPPPIHSRGEGERERQAQRLDLTLAQREADRVMLVDLEPGESAQIVELQPTDGARTGRRSRATRRFSVSGHRADLVMHEGSEGRALCVTLHAPPTEVEVFVQRGELQDQVRRILERTNDATAQDEP